MAEQYLRLRIHAYIFQAQPSLCFMSTLSTEAQSPDGLQEDRRSLITGHTFISQCVFNGGNARVVHMKTMWNKASPSHPSTSRADAGPPRAGRESCTADLCVGKVSRQPTFKGAHLVFTSHCKHPQPLGALA